MPTRFTFATIAALLCGTSTPAAAQEHYLFSYFTGNGEDGLHLAHSTDGVKWTAIAGGRSLLTPTAGNDRLMRDPSIVRGPDGVFHMVWTVSWGERGIGYASSPDLINWSAQKTVPVMEHEPTARNCWAPDIFYDEATGNYCIYWATTIPGRFEAGADPARPGREPYNHRIYMVTTKDFETFSDAMLCYDYDFSVIDSTVVKSGASYVMFLKNETERPAEKNIRIATSDSATGPFSEPTEPITGKYWAEGPTALRVGDKWFVYFDKYTEHKYGMVTSADPISDDPAAWTDESDALDVPGGMRHGTAFAVPNDVAEKLLKLQ